MSIINIILVGIVSLIHLYILFLEMFLWTKKKGIKTFGLKTKEFANQTKVMAANQGLYNGFLALGLIYSIVMKNEEIALLFLAFVFIAGLYGVYSTKNKKILFIQTIPALITIISFLLV